MVLQSVQEAYKLLRASKPILPIHRDKAPSMEILVNSRLKPGRCDDCTNVNSIFAESWGYEEVKNVFLQSVQTAYKLFRATKPIIPIVSGIVPPMEILVNSRLTPPRCDDWNDWRTTFLTSSHSQLCANMLFALVQLWYRWLIKYSFNWKLCISLSWVQE